MMRVSHWFQRLICLLLTVMVAISVVVWQEGGIAMAETKTTSAKAIPFGAQSLNGMWNFWPDISAVSELIAADNEATATVQTTLSGSPTNVVLDVPVASSVVYGKISALILISNNAFATVTEAPMLSVSVNGKEKRSVSLEGKDVGRNMWIDLPLNPADLQNGQNTLSLTAAPAGTVQLYGNSASALCVRIESYNASQATWQSIPVPAVWENNFTFPEKEGGFTTQQPQSSLAPILGITVNGGGRSSADLTSYKGKSNAMVEVPLALENLVSGNNTFEFNANVINVNQGIGNPTSLDLLLATPKATPNNGTGYWENSTFKQFASHEDYHVNLCLQRKDDDQWVTIATHNGDIAGNNLLVGVFSANGASYRPQVSLTIDDISLYKAAKLQAMMNVGNNITTTRSYDDAVLFDAATGEPFLRLGVNSTKNWTVQGLAPYTGTTSDVMIPVPISSLTAGNNQFYFHSNALNDSNMGTSSVDLMIENDTTYKNSAYSQDGLNSFQDMASEGLRFQVALALKEKSTGKWIEIAPYSASASKSLVVGKFTVNSSTYVPRVTLSVDNPALYSEAVLLAKLHVGDTVKVDGLESVHYDGVGWYNRTVTLPDKAQGSEQVLHFEAIDYYAEIFINGVFLGSHEGGYAPFDISLENAGNAVNYGGTNQLTVRVTDQSSDPVTGKFPIKETPAGFAQDTIGLNYAGIWGDVSLVSRSKVYVGKIYIDTNIQTGTATINTLLYNPGISDLTIQLNADILQKETGAANGSAATTVTVKAGERKYIPFTIKLNECTLWRIDDPHLYVAKLTVSGDNVTTQVINQTFGMRRIERQGKNIVLNGTNIFLTGWITWETLWDTIAPTPTEEQVRQLITDLKNYGFNAIKYCLVIPPDYVLDICDEMGIYVYIEYPIWEPVQTENFFTRCYTQISELIEKDRNHPSVIMSDFACELINYTPEMDRLLNWLVVKGKELDPNRLYTENSTVHTNKYGDFRTFHPYSSLTDFDRYVDGCAASRGDYPVILGEYADARTLSKYQTLVEENGGQEPWWWKSVAAPPHTYGVLQGLGFSEEQIEKIQDASYATSQEAKRGFLEASKSNPYVSGLFLTQLVDIRHNSCGFYDELGNLKYDADEIKGSASETVILMDDNVNQKRNFVAGKAYSLPLALSHFNGKDITNGTLTYTITAGSQVVLSGTVYNNMSLQHGKYYAFGNCLNFTLPNTSTAQKYVLTLNLQCDNFTQSNHWDIWAYPNTPLHSSQSVAYYDPDNLYEFASRYSWMTPWADGSNPKAVVTTTMTAGIESYLQAGGKVIYLGGGTGPVPGASDVDSFTNFTSSSVIFFPDESHPLATALATNGYGGAQFIPLTSPLVQPYATSGMNGKVIFGRMVATGGETYSLLSEYTVGSGKLLQCSLRLHEKETPQLIAGENPLGSYLLDQMVRYTLEESFTQYDQNLSPIYHVGLSTANSASPNWNDYRYIAQPFVPQGNSLPGIQLPLNLTHGNATVHLEIRENISDVPIATVEQGIISKGNGMHWYSILLDKAISVTPYRTYYLVYYLTERDSGSVCIAYGSDLGPGGAAHPGMVWSMASGAPITFTAQGNHLQFGFKLMSQNEVDGAIAEKVITQINELNVQSLDDKPAVVAARSAYLALTDSQKAYVPNLAKLEAAEAKIAEWEAAAIIKYGDVDGDDRVSATDALEVLKSVVGNVTLTEEQTVLADVDGNEKISSVDALYILKKVVGKIDQFPVEE